MWDFIKTGFASKAPLSSAKFHVPMKRRTLGVSGELHLELKALSVWRIKSHPKASPGITDTIQEMMRVYYKKYPEAKEFVEKFCE